ncbi:MAG: isochorismatase family protein [Clostridia bacterium]|nr:isochorismatase family protein [Clostridia bacterium]MCI8979649.1 isochorismatase family protein [Clostridia bacterium]MCI9086617.1 isochorismatase family protein [Clostridia bacterium]NDO18843.1 isochorismatase family protein [Lachnospiraceae bacterium MD329]
MKILLAVDLQKEFADKDGKYEEILAFLNDAVRGGGYDKVVATKCVNSNKSNFVRYNNWHKLIDGTSELEFKADEVIEKQSYGLTDYSMLPKDAEIDIIGYDTGACVLKIALDLFDRDYKFLVLSKYCYSTGGEEHHKRGLQVLSNLLENAVK